MILGTRLYKVLISVAMAIPIFFIAGYCERINFRTHKKNALERIHFPTISNTVHSSKKNYNLPDYPISQYNNKPKELSRHNNENNDKVIKLPRRNYIIRDGDFYSDCAINSDITIPLINVSTCSNNDYNLLPQLVNNNKFCFKPALLKGRAALCYGATVKGTIGCGSPDVVPFYLVPTTLINPANSMNFSGVTEKIYGELNFHKDPETKTSEIKLSEIYTAFQISIINSPIRIWDFSIFCYPFLRFPKLTMVTLSQNNISWPINFEETAHCDNALPSLSTIYLNDNPLIFLPTNVFASLQNSNVSYLNLRNCSLEMLGTLIDGKGPLTHLTKLKTIDLSNNKDLQDGNIALFLSPLAEGGNLEGLYLEEMHFMNFPYSTLQKVSKTLVRLDLDDSNIFTPIKFPIMNNLTDLSLDGCKLQKLDDDALKGLPNLKNLNISSNMFKSIPKAIRLSSLEILTFRNSRVDLYGNSEDLRLGAGSFQNMSSLLKLDLSQNRIHRLTAGVFDGLTSLTTLNLDDTHLEYIDAFSFRNLKNLYELKISNNNLRTLNSDMLSGLQNIVTICLNCNQINFDSSTKNHPFSHLKSLENLDLAYNYITNLPKVVYNMKSIKYVNLKYNQITTWNSPAFQNTNLTFLHLENNNINNITEAMVQDFTQKNVRKVSLSENHFGCSCYMLTLLANKTFSDIVNRFNGICNNNNSSGNCTNACTKCANSPKPQSNMHIMKYYVFPVFAALFGIIFMVVLFIRYKRRIASDISNDENQIEPAVYDRYFVYDVFVSYSAIDKDWTFTQLLPLLEETLGLQVCVHERDFNAGEFIENNIEACMHNSSKVLFLLSRGFLASKWCLFEFDVASSMSITEGRNMIVILKKDFVPEGIIPDNVNRQIQSRTYILWKNDSDYIKTIFRKLFKERINERSHAEYMNANSEPKGTYA